MSYKSAAEKMFKFSATTGAITGSSIYGIVCSIEGKELGGSELGFVGDIIGMGLGLVYGTFVGGVVGGIAGGAAPITVPIALVMNQRVTNFS